MTSTAAPVPPGATSRPLWRRLVGFNLLSALILGVAGYYIGWLIGHHIGGPSYKYEAKADENDVALLLVVIYLIYSTIAFRQPKGGALEGPAVRGDARVQTAWIVITSALVLSLAVYGTVRLESDYGAGSGNGPSPLVVPSGPKLPVQVIAQQWQFTYRYPTYGGLETTHLYLPVDRMIELHVTSIDVIHSFWAYQLGVKADANPDVDNVAFVKPTKLETFDVRCAELCGIWHGYMRDKGHVVKQAAFETWIHEQQSRLAPATKALPPYRRTYLPEPIRRGG